MTKTRVSLQLLLLSFLAGGLLACGGKQSSSSSAAAPAPAEAAEEEAEVEAATASIRLVHAAAAPSASIFAGDTELAANVAPGTWTQQRLTVPAGDHALSVRVGADTVTTANVSLSADGSYTVVVMGDASSATRANMPRIVAIRDNLGAPAAGQAHVRLIHAVPGAGAGALASDAGTTFVTNVSYGEASPFRTAAPGSTRIELRVGGDAAASGSAPFAEGRLFTVIAWPSPTGPALLTLNERPR